MTEIWINLYFTYWLSDLSFIESKILIFNQQSNKT